MTPTEIEARLRPADVVEGVKYTLRYRTGDVIANAVVLVAVLLAGLVTTTSWVWVGALLTLPVIALGRALVSSALGVRDGRAFLAYLDQLDDSPLADVVPLHGEATDL